MPIKFNKTMFFVDLLRFPQIPVGHELPHDRLMTMWRTADAWPKRLHKCKRMHMQDSKRELISCPLNFHELPLNFCKDMHQKGFLDFREFCVSRLPPAHLSASPYASCAASGRATDSNAEWPMTLPCFI